MREVAPSTTRSSRLANVTPRPLPASVQHLPVAGSPGSAPQNGGHERFGSGAGLVERRNLAARRMLAERIREEFMEMPGTSLTLAQASRLFGLSSDVCRRIFAELIGDGKLMLAADSRYRRHSAA